MLRRVLVVLAGVLVVGALAAGPAFGGLSYPFDGQLAPTSGSFAHETEGIAVDDANGQTYVAEGGGVVNVFETASGAQLAALDGSLTPAGSFGGGELAVAADDASGRVYVLDTTDGVVDVFDSVGGYVCQITGRATPSGSECNGVAGSDTPAHGFSEPHGIAVDQATGRVYVVDANNGAVDVFSASGAYLPSSSLSLASIEGGYSAFYTRAIAVDDANGHVYLADSGSVVVYEFGASGEFLARWTGANTPAGSFGGGHDSVAADNAGGEVYVTDTTHQVTDVFDSSGSYVTQFGGSAGASQVTAVDQTSGKVYVANHTQAIEIFGPAALVPDVTTGAASGVLPTGVTLNGSVNPDGVQLSDCHFEYGISTSYGQSAPCVPAAGAIPADSSEHAVSGTLTGLVAGTTYHFRLAAANANGPNEGADATFSTPPPPSIENASARNVTTTSADLMAKINPNGQDTTYRFEWGTSTGYGTSVPVPDVNAGAGTSGVPVTAHLSGLSASTTYHWRVVVQNGSGTTTTGDHTFIYSTAGATLPDGRAYEMVTPPHKNVALFGQAAYTFEYPDLAEDGSRMIAVSTACLADAGSCPANRSVGEPYAFTRTSSGWVTTALAPPATQFGGNVQSLVSAAAGTALFDIDTPPAGEGDWYARSVGGTFVDVGPVTSPSQGFGHYSGAVVATADFSHVVWEATEGRWPFDPTNGRATVYGYLGSGNVQPFLVGVSGGRGSTDLISGCATHLAGNRRWSSAALSADGRAVFFTAAQCSSGTGVNAGIPVPADELYARIDESRSVLLSGRSPADCTSAACLASPASEAEFQGASTDASKVFFTSTQQLTNAAGEDNAGGDSARGENCAQTVGANGCNLYEYDFAAPVEHNLVAVSAGDSSGGGPRVQGVAAVSPDGSHVYFVARGVLTGSANGVGRVAVDGGANLYVYERDARFPSGHVAFVATLSDVGSGQDESADSKQWLEAGGNLMNVTPDGRFLVFTSRGELTPDDTSTTGVPQVFRYDAQTGELVRISIGDRGFNDNGNGGITCASGGCAALAATIVTPSGRGARQAGALRPDPTMSHDGSYVFFESPAALVPGALDDVQVAALHFLEGATLPIYAQNVYEYHEGRVYLISDGKDLQSHENRSAARLLGSDATGANVFFMTADPLVTQDTDTQQDIYDARVCTASEPCVTSPPPSASCQGEACHGTAGVAPEAPGAGSVSFAGAGNLTAPSAGKAPASRKAAVKCAKGKRSKRGSCVKARKRKKSKKASTKRAKANHGGKK